MKHDLGRVRHTCHATGCETEVPPKLFMCRRHWFALSKEHRDRILALCRPGQENDKDPSPEYLDAARAAIASLNRPPTTTTP